MILRFHLCLAVFFVHILFAACLVESKQFLSPGKDVYPLQWRFFTKRMPQDFRGWWIWFFPSGAVRIASLSTRKFDVPLGENKMDPQTILQTNTYENGTWNPGNETFQRYLYKNGNPPTYAQRILPNGTLGSAFPALVYVQEDVYWVLAPIRGMAGNPRFGFEMFLGHPREPDIRFSIVPIYVNYRFAYVVLIREVDGAPVYPTKFWTNSRKASPRQELPLMTQRRFWRGSTKCIFKNYILRTTGVFKVTDGWNLPSQPKERMSILEFPDNLTFYYPKTIADTTEGRSPS